MTEDITEHQPIALTQPEFNPGDLSLTDIVKLDMLQHLQDAFSEAFNIPSIIYGIDGRSITKPSRFSSFCKLVRSTEKGLDRCQYFDGKLMNILRETHKPIFRSGCILSNMMTGTIPIMIQGQHMANWGVGHLITSELNLEEVRQYARDVGLDEEELIVAAKTLVPIDKETFKRVSTLLSTLSEQISLLALQNLKQRREIAERKRAEAALHRERRLFISGPTVIFRWVAAEGWPVEYVSPNVDSVFGWTAEDFISGRVPFSTVIHPDDVSRVAREVDQHSRENAASFQQEYRIIRSDGEIRRLLDFTIINRDKNETITHYEGYVLDITEHRLAEEKLELLMLAIEQAAEIIVITDTEATIQYVNPAFERITGYKLDEVIGKNPNILKSRTQDDAYYKEMWDTLTLGETWTGRFVNRKKDGTLFTEDTTISPVRDSFGKTVNYVAVKRDITDEIRLEDQLRQSQKMEAVGQLAGGVAHDFNNLLQIINGYVEMAMGDIDPVHPTQDYFKEVLKAGNSAKKLVSQLLSFSRRQVIKPENLDLNEVIDNLMKMIRQLIGKHIECDFIPGDELRTVHTDHGQMEQVLMNLCINSHDSMPDGGTITIETGNILFSSEDIRMHPWAKPGRYVQLSVTDIGCGMDEETLSRIFDPFFTTKEVGKGTGLGLSTVYGIVKQYNGQIQAHSEVGKGTIFKVYLPAIDHQTAEVSNSVQYPVIGGTETILVAEDDNAIRKLTVQILERAGYTVLTAGDGEEAVRLFEAKADEIALTLLDVMMPGLSGKRVYDRLKKDHCGARVLFSTGYSHNAIHTNFILSENLQLIQKPYGSDALLRRIREVLDA